MTDGQLWQIMLKLKIFTPAMVLKEANPPQYLREHVKGKIKSLIQSQLKNGILVKYHNDPAVFGLPGQDIESIKRTCKMCGSKFIPRDDNQYCSKECEKEHVRQHLEENLEKEQERVISKKYTKKYTEEEEKLIYEVLSVHGLKKTILRELAKKLGRDTESIKNKYRNICKKKQKKEKET